MNSSGGLVLAVICIVACGTSAEHSNDNFLFNLIWKCSRSDYFENCLKARAAVYLDELVRMKEPLVITEFLSLPKDPKFSGMSPRGLNESEMELESGRSEEAKGKYLDKLIWDKLAKLFTTRTIQLNLSSEMFEGRGKDKVFKKGHGFFLMTAMMGSMMLKMALGKIALIAGKALVVGKIALILTLLMAVRRFARRGAAPEVVFTSAELGGGRKFGANSVWNEDAGDLAYNAHKPDNQNKI